MGRLLKDSSARGARGKDQGVSADLSVLPNLTEPGQTGRVWVSSGHAAAHVGFMKASGAWLTGARCRGCCSVGLEDAGLWAPPLFPRPAPPPQVPLSGLYPDPESGGFCPSAERGAVPDCVWRPLASLFTISLLQGRLFLEKFSFIDFYF